MNALIWVEPLGYFACTLVFISSCMKTLLPLRAVAAVSNLVFIVYALMAGLTPVLILHAILLPLNLWRGVEAAHN